MCRSSQIINATVLTIVSKIKDDFCAGWANNEGDSQPAEKNAPHWHTVALASLSSLGYACCIKA